MKFVAPVSWRHAEYILSIFLMAEFRNIQYFLSFIACCSPAVLWCFDFMIHFAVIYPERRDIISVCIGM